MRSGKYCRTMIIAAALLWLPSAGAAARALDEAHGLTRQLIEQKMKDLRIPGVQVAVIRGDRIVLSESYGFANIENRVPVTSATLFPINSATKSFTGVATMQLVEAGLVDLNAPVSRYLKDLPEAWRGIRIRQLLGHTSGLPDIVDQEGLIGDGSELSAWDAVKDLPMDTVVGAQFSYNQTNDGLLAQIISKHTNMPYEKYIAEHQFVVAKMSLSTFGDSDDLVPNSATIYATTPRGTLAPDDGNRLSKWIYEMPYSLWAGGGIQTTAEELALWLLAFSNSRLINHVNVQKMWIPEKLNSGVDSDWAARWPVLQASPHRVVAGIGGARAAFFVYPDDGLSIVVLTNLAGANPQRFIPQIAEFYKSVQPPGSQ